MITITKMWTRHCVQPHLKLWLILPLTGLLINMQLNSAKISCYVDSDLAGNEDIPVYEKEGLIERLV